MKKRHLVYAIALIVGMGACAASAKKQAEAKPDVWKSYNVGTVLFEDKASETKGSDIYHRIIPDAESYIKEQARTVLATLYNSPEDSITPVNKIHWKTSKEFLPKAVVMETLLSSTAHGISRNHLRKTIRQSCSSKRVGYCCTN